MADILPGREFLLMNPELEELYQEVILDHSRRPRNFGELADADSSSTATIRLVATRFSSESNSRRMGDWRR